MTRWEELQAYVAFGPADSALLAELAVRVEPRMDWLIDRFYEAIGNNPTTRAVLQDDSQIERLARSMRNFLLDMLNGPHDEAFHDRCRLVGQVHVRVGLPEPYVFTAMNLVRRDLCVLARETSEESWDLCQAVMKVTDLVLCVMSSSYLEAHEDKRLRSLQDLIMQSLPVTVLCLDQDGAVTSATRPTSVLFQRDARVGEHYTRHLPAAFVMAADLPAQVAEALQTGREVALSRVELPGPRVRHFRVNLVPLRHELARLLIHIEELTDVVEAEARMQQAESLARVGSMSAQLAHEIRNPIAAISATLQVIGRSLEEDDRRKPILGRVQEQVHRMDRLVRDLLNYARPPEMNSTDVLLSELAAESLRQSAVPAVLIKVEDRTVRADPASTHQILVNLLQNARDAAGEGSWIGLQIGPGPCLRVLDAGPGVSDVVRKTLFEPFITTRQRGTGLGLAISLKRARAQGGTLALSDSDARWPAEVRRGAAFCLCLPEPAA